jgi:hypothetical protein
MWLDDVRVGGGAVLDRPAPHPGPLPASGERESYHPRRFTLAWSPGFGDSPVTTAFT